MKRAIFLKSIIIGCCLVCISGVNAQNDPKYLAGAVPEINGKVVFSDTLSLSGMSAAQVYETALAWAKANYNTEENRVAYTSKEQLVISCRGKSELIFSSSALSLDKALMNYQLNLFGMDQACRIEMKSINYEYNVSNKKEPERYLADKWITDKETVNGDKLYKMNGKFRMKTIDLFDDICNSLNLNLLSGEIDLYTDKNKTKLYARKNLSEQSPKKNAPATSTSSANIPDPEVITVSGSETAVNPNEIELSGYKKLDPEKLPGNIIKMLNNDWMLITAGNAAQFNMMTASWGGLGVLYGKPVAFCFVNPARYTYQLMETGDTYTLSFYTETYREALRYCGSTSGKDTDKVKGSGLSPITLPSGCKSFSEAWMIIECKKLVSQQIQAESVTDKSIRDEWSKSRFHKMYIGEILNVWVK